MVHSSDEQIGIVYLPLPEPRPLVVQPQQSIDFKHQIEQDFRTRHRYLSHNELTEIFRHLTKTDAERYEIHYRLLYQRVLESILNSVDLNDEYSQLKHALNHTNTILSIALHNRQLARDEKKIFYNRVANTWQMFDERIQIETDIYLELKHIKREHQHLRDIKIQQEIYQKFDLKLHEIKMDISNLKKEIQQLHEYKYQLKDQIRQVTVHRLQTMGQLDFLKSNRIRLHTNELNNLQLERDSLVTQSALIKSALGEQTQQFDHVLDEYRTSLTLFQSNLIELEQQLKQQTDEELSERSLSRKNSIGNENFPSTIEQRRETLKDDSQRLIAIFEEKIDEKRTIHIQLTQTIDEFQVNILREENLLKKRENDWIHVDQRMKELTNNIEGVHGACLQLRNERRTLERQLMVKSKRFASDDRNNRMLILRQDLLLAKQKSERIRTETIVDGVFPLIEENDRLKAFIDRLTRESTRTNPEQLLYLRHRISRLHHTHKILRQQIDTDDSTRKVLEKDEQQIQMKNNRIALKIAHCIRRMNTNEFDTRINNEHIARLEVDLTNQQHDYLQLKYVLSEMKNRSDSIRTNQHLIQMQIQVADNNTKYSQHRSNNLDEQLIVCRNDLLEQRNYCNKLRDFHSVLEQQDHLALRKLSTIYMQITDLERQVKHARERLEQTKQYSIKLEQTRSILASMIVRRVGLCQMLYHRLTAIDAHIRQRDRNVSLLIKCLQSLKVQIRNHHRQFLKHQGKYQLETVRIHVKKMLDRTREKQMLLTRQIFRRRFHVEHIQIHIPSERAGFLRTKISRLKNRLIKLISRSIVCNLVLTYIEQAFVDDLKHYISKSHRQQCTNLNAIRMDFNEFMRTLKSKIAEHNLLIDYRDYFRLIHMDTIEQLTQWKSQFE